MSQMKRRELVSWLASTSLFSALIPGSNPGAGLLNPLTWFSNKSGLSLLPYHPTKIVIQTVLDKGSIAETLTSWRNKDAIDAEVNRLTHLGHMTSCTSVKFENSITSTYEFSSEAHRVTFAKWLVEGNAVSIEKMRSLGIKTYHNLT